MTFVDTNVLLSYAFINDPRHDHAEKLLEEVRKVSQLYLSPLVIFEIYCVVPRRIIPIGCFKLPDPLQEMLNRIPQVEERLEESIEVVLSFLRSTLNLKLCSDEEVSEISQLGGALIVGELLRLLNLYLFGIKKSPKLKQRALDTLHLTYVYEYAKKGYPSAFVTFDRDIKNQAKTIEQEIGVKII